ncbi:MAG TPA: T9SS type A sorting domain-containing protein, partial [Bacteroidia bacterium]|nr:T9SS type A sorting domain-containing protein [Bacteroidia bacterium]
NDRPAGITFDGSGNIFVTGESDADTSSLSSNYDIVTIKYNSNGVQQWVKTYDGIAGDDDNGVAVAIDNITGYAYVCGQCNNGSIVSKNNDIVLLQYDPAGNQMLIGTYDAAGGSDGPSGINIRGNNIYVAGSSVGNGNSQKDMVMLFYTGFNVGMSPFEMENSISVFPDPCRDFTTIHFEKQAQHHYITITDINGKVVLNTETALNEIRIETSQLAPGFYSGTIISDGESKKQFKLIVQ